MADDRLKYPCPACGAPMQHHRNNTDSMILYCPYRMELGANNHPQGGVAYSCGKVAEFGASVAEAYDLIQERYQIDVDINVDDANETPDVVLPPEEPTVAPRPKRRTHTRTGSSGVTLDDLDNLEF